MTPKCRWQKNKKWIFKTKGVKLSSGLSWLNLGSNEGLYEQGNKLKEPLNPGDFYTGSVTTFQERSCTMKF